MPKLSDEIPDSGSYVCIACNEVFDSDEDGPCPECGSDMTEQV